MRTKYCNLQLCLQEANCGFAKTAIVQLDFCNFFKLKVLNLIGNASFNGVICHKTEYHFVK